MTSRRIIYISYFIALTVLSGFIRISFGGVVFTLQTVVVVSSGFFLGGADGAIVQLCYMFLGLLGVPIFTEGGGFSYVIKPTFGYIISFPLGAFIAGKLLTKRETLSGVRIFLSGTCALLPIYLIGIAYNVIILILLSNTLFEVALMTVVLPNAIYFAVDVLFMCLLAVIFPRVNSLVGRGN